MNNPASASLFKEALEYFPGGVNSPVRAFRSVGGTPLFIEKGEGCRITDADGRIYIDFCCSWGPLILGHAHSDVVQAVSDAVASGSSFGAPTRKENALAKLILDHHPYLERIRFVSSGTEAVMSALRLARGATGRSMILKFEGCYHGHVDALLVSAGSGLVTFGESFSAGIPESYVKETIICELDNIQAIESAFASYGNRLAAAIIEPLPANNGLLLQNKDFLLRLRELCTDYGVMLIFDEVISGFRLGFSGAAGFYEVKPDIITFGKIIGGGLPVGAYGGSAEIMNHISPAGKVYQAGTLSGNPVAMSAGLAQLSHLVQPGFYDNLSLKTDRFLNTIRSAFPENPGFRFFSAGSVFWLAFTEEKSISKASQIDPQSMQKFRVFYHNILERGVYMGPSGYEVGFVSAAHSDDDLQLAAAIITDALAVALKV
jgi:glutamate-1-semialdehyde 2,1-aminomutase